MSQVNSLINARLKKNPASNKMMALAELSVAGNRSTFSGIFQVSELSHEEKNELSAILDLHREGDFSPSDLQDLEHLTKEVKALNHQAALLHGERIQKVQKLLKNYRQGAFSAWLKLAYGNRQTPYNLLQYYEFWQELPAKSKSFLEKMPRQAVYTLASRDASLSAKQQFVEAFKGETKEELLKKIRSQFPLKIEDQRKEKVGQSLILSLNQILKTLSLKGNFLSKGEKREIAELLTKIQEAL